METKPKKVAGKDKFAGTRVKIKGKGEQGKQAEVATQEPKGLPAEIREATDEKPASDEAGEKAAV